MLEEIRADPTLYARDFIRDYGAYLDLQRSQFLFPTYDLGVVRILPLRLPEEGGVEADVARRTVLVLGLMLTLLL